MSGGGMGVTLHTAVPQMLAHGSNHVFAPPLYSNSKNSSEDGQEKSSFKTRLQNELEVPQSSSTRLLSCKFVMTSANGQTFLSSRIRTINRRPRLTTLKSEGKLSNVCMYVCIKVYIKLLSILLIHTCLKNHLKILVSLWHLPRNRKGGILNRMKPEKFSECFDIEKHRIQVSTPSLRRNRRLALLESSLCVDLWDHFS